MLEVPVVELAIIVKKETKILLGEKVNFPKENNWEFPGGEIYKFKDFLNQGKLEVKKETGLDVEIIGDSKIISLRDVFSTRLGDYLTFYQEAKYLNGEPKVMESKKCLGWKWFEWNDLPKNLSFSIQNLIKTGYNPFR
jgi:8-oxo-dGTP diphosphatase